MAIVRGLTTLSDVRKSIYGDAYATTPTTMDTDLEAYISAATPVIENIAGPMYAESRTVTLNGGTGAVALPFRFNAVTSVTVDGTAYTSYTSNPAAGVIYAGLSSTPDVFAPGTQNVVVIVTVGYATIPPHVQLATRELVRHWWQQGRQGNRPVFGNDAEAQDAPMGFAVPRRVYQLLEPTPRLAGFA